MKDKNIFVALLVIVVALLCVHWTINERKIQQNIFQNDKKENYLSKEDILPSGTLDCKNFLAYNFITLKQPQYLKWYGKVGTDIRGTKYLPGHFIQQHVAINQKCTAYQIQNKKTVFATYQEVVKAIKFQNVACNFSIATHFTYDQHAVIASPSDYIKGIDCSRPQNQILTVFEYFPKFFIQFKRTVLNPSPSQQEYMNSTKTTVWTFYPERS